MNQTLAIIVIVLILGGAIYVLARSADSDTGIERNGKNEDVVCTMDAKLCPDGSYVGRVGPVCAFAACPGATSTDAIDTTGGGGVY